MKYGIVHYKSIAYHQLSAAYSSCKIAMELPDSRSKSLWNESLHKMGFDITSIEPTVRELFQFVKTAFERQKGELLDIEFAKGYIASLDGTSPIPANEASRLCSEEKQIYVDELILSALFDYVATYYLWAKDFHNKDVYVFCFQYTAILLNYACRLGILTDDERRTRLVEQITDNCDIRAVNLISDLYWSCLAFAFCHEIAHIYLKHKGYDDESHTLWEQEFEADAVGYDVYLTIIETAQENAECPFEGVFHDYLYVAPMILFQFYEDAYFMSYWLFGERAGNSHPTLQARISALLDISEQSKYTFETKEGNILLNNYMDVSDLFREELILKLQKGKLDDLIKRGVAHMSKSGYSEAMRFQKDMCDDLLSEAEERGWDSKRLIGLWDMAVDIELLDSPGDNAFVWSHNGNTYSTKAFNVRFSLKKVLTSVLEFGASWEVTDFSTKTILLALLILCKLAEITTIKLSDDHAAALIKCHELHADKSPVIEEELLQQSGVSSAVISELASMGCISIKDGTIQLNEEIYIR